MTGRQSAHAANDNATCMPRFAHSVVTRHPLGIPPSRGGENPEAHRASRTPALALTIAYSILIVKNYFEATFSPPRRREAEKKVFILFKPQRLCPSATRAGMKSRGAAKKVPSKKKRCSARLALQPCSFSTAITSFRFRSACGHG